MCVVCVKQMPSGSLLHSTGSSALCSVIEGWDGGWDREAQEGRDICIVIVDSHCCTAETNITL